MKCLSVLENKVCVTAYQPDFKKDLIRLANLKFGEGYFTNEKLDDYLSAYPSLFLATEGDELLGFCLFLVEHVAHVARAIKLDVRKMSKLGAGSMVCHTKSMAVSERASGTGIARELFHTCLLDAMKKGARSAWGSAWKVGSKIPMESIFLCEGFSQHCEVPLAWYDDEQYNCVVCGGRCECTGVIYYKVLRTEEQPRIE